ncbi:MAG TPA: hypothetical protein VF595_18170 [Tepidisphaeraceae bacterium]|jgi:uncharacterized coiled-coil protein SlyX
MSPTIAELEKALAAQVAEHRILLAAVNAHLDAMRTFSLPDITAAADAVEASRGRAVHHEKRRLALMAQVVRTHKLQANVTLAEIAVAVPAHRMSLMRLRDELRELTADIAARTGVSAKVAAAMMGHLNTVVRLVAGAVKTAAVYTKQGQRTVANRVGVMEAVG